MTIERLNQQVDKDLGKSGGWPSDLSYLATERTDIVEVAVTDARTAKDGVWKKIDPWAFAFYDEVKKIANKPLRLELSLRSPDTPLDKCRYEALKRRVSYLKEANQMEVSLLRGSADDKLYSMAELTHRPDGEKVHTGFKERSDADTPGRLEKDFQTWLFGKGLHENSDSAIKRTNERLALFGPDFVRIGKLKSVKDQNGYKVQREFPTGAFNEEVKKANRILPTELVDLVTLNRNGDLAVIEIKFDDPKLEAISQVLNYALYFHSYRSKLTPLLDQKLKCGTVGLNLVTYLVSNAFHDRFKSVWPYYSQGPLTIKQVIMGYMP